MKLSITHPKKEDIPSASTLTGYESPVGWWRVTTEGDVEGRTTKTLGDFYGHVAEIAFALAKESFYALEFSPIKNKDAGAKQNWQATGKSVWIRLDVYSGAWRDNREKMVETYKKWLDADDQIEVCEKGDCGERYYAAVYLKLK